MEKTEMMKRYEQETGKSSISKIDIIVPNGSQFNLVPTFGYARFLEEELLKVQEKATAYDRLMGESKLDNND